jgi:hypothetical protein
MRAAPNTAKFTRYIAIQIRQRLPITNSEITRSTSDPTDAIAPPTKTTPANARCVTSLPLPVQRVTRRRAAKKKIP